MKISPILSLTVGTTFALLYSLIITIGWAITRRNRKIFHHSVGINKMELFDLKANIALNKYVNGISLSNNTFEDENNERIFPENYKCYIVDKISPEFPKIKKGFLIFINPQTNKIEYAFKIPSLENYR